MSDITRVTCWCSVEFAIPTALYNTCRGDTRQAFHCPLGHSNVFRESDADVLRRERDRLKQALAQKDDEISFERKSAEAARRKVKRVERRANAGVCQCCQRTFSNVARHMATKHPELKKPRLVEKVG